MTAAQLIRAPLHCDLAETHRGAIAVIGNMDGVHRGHQALVRATVRFAEELRARPSAIVFEPHPRRAFRPESEPFLLTDLTTKSEILGELGIAIVFALPFVQDLYRQSPEEFVHTTLHQRLGVRGIMTGADFQFGAGRAGNVAALAALATDAGIAARSFDPVLSDDSEKISSTMVRDALIAGDVSRAATLLGRPWEISGTVVEGQKLARTLNFPTANIPLADYVRPKFGVYIVDVIDGTERLAGIANIGRRPTVGGGQELLEAHLIDEARTLYGKRLRVALRAFLRPERKFEGLEALRQQIAQDVETARRWHTEKNLP